MAVELVRRQHTHLLLPHASLDAPQRALFEVALRPAGWVADPDENSTMSLRWRRDHAALRVQTLGWFPLLVTVGPIGKPSAVHRDAAARLTAAVLAGGGKSFTDRQLVEYLPQSQLRWQRALMERQRLSTAERLLQARRCQLRHDDGGLRAGRRGLATGPARAGADQGTGHAHIRHGPMGDDQLYAARAARLEDPAQLDAQQRARGVDGFNSTNLHNCAEFATRVHDARLGRISSLFGRVNLPNRSR